MLGDRLFQVTFDIHCAVKDTQYLDLIFVDDEVRDSVMTIENLSDFTAVIGSYR